jgi:hypothetical protein
MLMTTSPVALAFNKVCLTELSRTRRAGENIITGGFALKTLKNEYGDKFTLPFASIVLAKAIGRG